MAINPDLLQKPFDKSRKALKSFPKLPSPDEVHRLRTQIRRVEAVLHALLLDRQRYGGDLVEALAPVRKTAGKVRDMDVLVGFASSLASASEDETLVQLLEYLGKRRFEAAAELHDAIAAHKKKARSRLKKCSRSIEKLFGPRKQMSPSSAATDAVTVALELSAELGTWPKLDASNIHPFRLKVKELRYIFELAEDHESALFKALGEAKDAIGKWHDWNELALIAEDVVDDASTCELTQRIRERAGKEFKVALRLAEQMRKQYLGDTKRKRSNQTSSIQPKSPIVTATALLAG